jgi:predicted nucleic acid-binding protein
MELLKGAQNARELRNIERFLAKNFTQIIPISASASRLAVDLIRRYTLAQGLTLPDALIAAITLSVKGKLVTGNRRDFSYIRGLKVETPAYRSVSP